MIRYFVSYSHQRGNGWTVVEVGGHPTSEEDVEALNRLVDDRKPHLGGVVVVNFVPLGPAANVRPQEGTELL